jgi:hypothetical protein
LAENELVLDFLYIVLAILWVGLFLQNKRKGTINLSHIILFVFASGILLNSLYEVINSWWFY